MYSRINIELKDIRSRLNYRNQLAERTGHLTEIVKPLGEQLENINWDIEKLGKKIVSFSGFSTGAALEMLIGRHAVNNRRREARLNRLLTEQQQLINNSKPVVDEMNRLIDEIEKLQDVDNEYRLVLIRKEKMMLDNGHRSAERIMAIKHAISNMHETMDALDQAIEIGNTARYSLMDAEKYMGNAEFFGYWDLLKGGLFASILKQNSVSKSREVIDRSVYYLEKFNANLEDVTPMVESIAKIPGLELDIFVDGLLSYLLIQPSISKSKKDIGRTIDETCERMNLLKNTKEQLQENITSLNAERIELIIAAN